MQPSGFRPSVWTRALLLAAGFTFSRALPCHDSLSTQVLSVLLATGTPVAMTESSLSSSEEQSVTAVAVGIAEDLVAEADPEPEPEPEPEPGV